MRSATFVEELTCIVSRTRIHAENVDQLVSGKLSTGRHRLVESTPLFIILHRQMTKSGARLEISVPARIGHGSTARSSPAI